jgi:hypothetical protein
MKFLSHYKEMQMAIDGKYNVEVDTPMGKFPCKLTLKASGEVLTGTIETQLGSQPLTGTVSGENVAFSTEMKSPMGNIKLDVTCQIKGVDVSGQVKAGNFGTAPIKGTKE